VKTVIFLHEVIYIVSTKSKQKVFLTLKVVNKFPSYLAHSVSKKMFHNMTWKLFSSSYVRLHITLQS